MNSFSRQQLTYNLLGPQGSGKGTQAAALVEHFNFFHVDMGQYLRDLVQTNSQLGQEIAEHINQGTRVPATQIAAVTLQALSNLPPGQDVLFDGLLRGLDELEAQIPIFNQLSLPLPIIILLEVDEQTSIERIGRRRFCLSCHLRYTVSDAESENARCLKCNQILTRRDDDTPSAIKRRLAWYYQDTVPVVDYFRQHGTVIEIDARPSIEEVKKDLIARISKYYE